MYKVVLQVMILEVILELMKSVMQPVCLTATASWIQMSRIFYAGKENSHTK